MVAVILGVLMSSRTIESNQGEMLSQLKRHKVQVLLKVGFDPRTLASEGAEPKRGTT